MKNKLKNFGRKIARVLKSRTFLKNMGLAISIVLFFLVFAFLFLRVYTLHGKAFSVPDLTGLTINEAERVIEDNNLRYEITDSVYIQNQPGGTVVEQNPEPNFKVKKNRTIFLTTNAMKPEMVEMPNVVGLSLRQASSELETHGLHTGQITYIPDIAKNNVLYQKHDGKEIKPGKEIPKGSEISLVLGKGLSHERTHPPNLTGLRYNQARERILENFLNVGAIIYDETISSQGDTLKAIIFKQKPGYQPGVSVNLGSSIDLWLTMDSSKIPRFKPVNELPEESDDDLYEID